MAETSNSILQKLDGLEARFEEVSTLITDPSVIADQQRFVKLTKEYKDLGDIMDARTRYIACLNGIKEDKDILANESDPEMKEMAREQVATRLACLQEICSRCTRTTANQRVGRFLSPTYQRVQWEDSRRLTSLYRVPMFTAR